MRAQTMCSYGVWYGSDVDQGVGEKLGIHNFCRKLGLKTAVSFFKITELVAGENRKTISPQFPTILYLGIRTMVSVVSWKSLAGENVTISICALRQ